MITINLLQHAIIRSACNCNFKFSLVRERHKTCVCIGFYKFTFPSCNLLLSCS